MSDQTFPEPKVGIFIFNREGELLLLNSHKWPGKYVIPGDHVELGEWIKEAALHLPIDTYTSVSLEKILAGRKSQKD